jgi:predicted nucleic acid-binding protein
LIDSDASIGWMVAFDANHQQARQIFHQLKEKKSRLVTTSFVVAETASVLSHRSG